MDLKDGYINIELVGGTGELSYSWTGSFGEFLVQIKIFTIYPQATIL